MYVDENNASSIEIGNNAFLIEIEAGLIRVRGILYRPMYVCIDENDASLIEGFTRGIPSMCPLMRIMLWRTPSERRLLACRRRLHPISTSGAV